MPVAMKDPSIGFDTIPRSWYDFDTILMSWYPELSLDFLQRELDVTSQRGTWQA